MQYTVIFLATLFQSIHALTWEEYQPNAHRVGDQLDPIQVLAGLDPTQIIKQDKYSMSEYTLEGWDKGYKGYYTNCLHSEKAVVPIPIPPELNINESHWMCIIKSNTVYRDPLVRTEDATQQGGDVVFITGKYQKECGGPELFIPLRTFTVEEAEAYF